MRTKLLLIALTGIFVSIAGAQERHSINHCGHNDYDDDYYEDYYEEDCGSDYGYYNSDFIIGNRVYHWFTNHYGRRILKCREIYHDPHYGVYYGPWEIAYDFDWDHYNHWYFTWCPDLGLYYYNHPHFVSYYHSIHSQVIIHVNSHNYHPKHVVVWKPWIQWKPWKFWMHKKWNTVWNPKLKVKHVYKPHIKHGKVYKKKRNHYIYENTNQHKYVYKKKNSSKHGKVYINSGSQLHRETVVKKKYENQNNKYVVKKKSSSATPKPKVYKKENYQTSPKSTKKAVTVQKKAKIYEPKKAKPISSTGSKNKTIESYTFNKKNASNKNNKLNNVKLTNSTSTYRRKK